MRSWCINQWTNKDLAKSWGGNNGIIFTTVTEENFILCFLILFNFFWRLYPYSIQNTNMQQSIKKLEGLWCLMRKSFSMWMLLVTQMMNYLPLNMLSTFIKYFNNQNYWNCKFSFGPSEVRAMRWFHFIFRQFWALVFLRTSYQNWKNDIFGNFRWVLDPPQTLPVRWSLRLKNTKDFQNL